jgi:hypothetical protein
VTEDFKTVPVDSSKRWSANPLTVMPGEFLMIEFFPGFMTVTLDRWWFLCYLTAVAVHSLKLELVRE